MKKLFFSSLMLLAIAAGAQETSEIKPAAKGVVYGEAVTATGTVTNVNDLQLAAANAVFDGKVTGRVKEVCKSMGCWIRLEKAGKSKEEIKKIKGTVKEVQFVAKGVEVLN